MIKTEYNEDTIRQDIENLMKDLDPRHIEFDIRPFVEPNLIRLGYPYTFNDDCVESTSKCKISERVL